MYFHSVPPPLSTGGGRGRAGVEPPTKFSNREDLNFERGVSGKEGVTFSTGWGCNFYVKDN